MALGVVAFVAEQRDGAGRGARQGVEQRALGREVLAKVAEETLQVPIFAKSITQIARGAERALVCVPDALLGERGGECSLGESLAPGDRKLANVEQLIDAGGLQGLQKISERDAFIADGEHPQWGLHEREPCERPP